MAISLGTATLSKMYLGVSEITKAYLGATQIFGGTTVDTYAANGISPEFVADFANNYYRVASNDSTFASALTFSRSGNATMVDSDGLIKWAPHNLVLNSGSPATQSITVVSGADYTVECTGLGSVALSGAGTGTVSSGAPVEITASTTTLTLTVLGTVETMWAYRSDLGGMVDNPETSNSYVPTTGTARYLSRLGHHVYNGSSYVNEGILVESEARTNLVKNSTNLFSGSTQTINPWFGDTSGREIIASAGTSEHLSDNSQIFTSVGTNGPAITTLYLQKGTADFVRIKGNGPAPNYVFDVVVSLVDGTLTRSFNSADNVYTKYCGSGKWKIFIEKTLSSNVGGRPNFSIGPHDGSNSPTWTALGTESVVYCGLQIEEGSTPSSYIPTAGSTVTRAADSLTIAAANWTFNASGTSYAIDGRVTYKDINSNNTAILLSFDASSLWYVRLSTNSSPNQFENVYWTPSGNTFAEAGGSGLSEGVLEPYSFAARVSDTFNQSAEGGTAGTEASVPNDTPTNSSEDIDVGFRGSLVSILTVKSIRLWSQDIGTTGIEETSS